MSPAAPPVIAIDGPAASGKGTVAVLVARALGFHTLDSGVLYRLVALVAQREGIDLADSAALGTVARGLPVRFKGGTVLLAGARVDTAIRAEGISSAASKVAAHPAVRNALLERQRAFRQPPGLVAEGRDMGTIVFPDAALKIFLVASPEKRAERRYKQLMDKGLSANIQTLLQEILERDARDRSRANAPLRAAADAHTVDTTDLAVEQVVEKVLALWRNLNQAPRAV